MRMSTAAWKTAKLDELGFVGRGKSRHRPRDAAFLYGGRYPFFQTGDIKAANFHLTEYRQTYSDEGLAQSKLWKPGTLCITIAANIAESAVLGIDGCFPDSVVGFVADPQKADVRFVKYFIDTLKLQMQSISRGTTQDNLSLDKLLSFDLRVPPLSLQREIAGILAAYDDLIENNRRRIRILEGIARFIYHEWFVNFRFPGHEKAQFVESPLGRIPTGWRVCSVAELAHVYRGRSYRSDDLVGEGGLPFVNLKCLDRDGGFRRYGLKRYSGEFKAENTVREGDIVMAVTDMTQERRIVARAAWIPTLGAVHGVISMDLVRIEPKGDVPKPYLYGFFRFSGFSDEVKQHANGANVLHLSPDRIRGYDLALPPLPLTRLFSESFGPMLALSGRLESQIENVRRTRDLLLPKLMSGEIDVAHLASEHPRLSA